MIKYQELKINKLKAVIFDMDGVLVDTEPVYYRVEQELFKRLDLNISKEVHHSFVGLSMKTIWEKITSENRLELTIEELISLHKKLMIRGFKSVKDPQPIPGILGIMQLLKSYQIKIALASSSSHELINVILQKTGLKAYFDVIVSGDDVKEGKPEPDIFLKALSLLNVEKQEVLIIEDSANGILAARQAEIPVIAYHNLNSGAQDLNRADLIIENFTEFYTLLLKNLVNWN